MLVSKAFLSWFLIFSHSDARFKILVRVQFFRLEPYKGIEGIGWEEHYLPRIIIPSSLNWHTFHHIYIMSWCRIFFCKHCKLCFKFQQEHHVLMADILIMTSQCRFTRAQPIIHCDACTVWPWKIWKSCHEVSLAGNKKMKEDAQSKTIH